MSDNSSILNHNTSVKSLQTKPQIVDSSPDDKGRDTLKRSRTNGATTAFASVMTANKPPSSSIPHKGAAPTAPLAFAKSSPPTNGTPNRTDKANGGARPSSQQPSPALAPTATAVNGSSINAATVQAGLPPSTPAVFRTEAPVKGKGKEKQTLPSDDGAALATSSQSAPDPPPPYIPNIRNKLKRSGPAGATPTRPLLLPPSPSAAQDPDSDDEPTSTYDEITIQRFPDPPRTRRGNANYISPWDNGLWKPPHIPKWKSDALDRMHRPPRYRSPWSHGEFEQRKRMKEAGERLERFYEKARRRVKGEFKPSADDEDYLAEPYTMKVLEWVHRTELRRQRDNVTRDEDYLYSSDTTDVDYYSQENNKDTFPYKRARQKSDLYWHVYGVYTSGEEYGFQGKLEALRLDKDGVMHPLSDQDEDEASMNATDSAEDSGQDVEVQGGRPGTPVRRGLARKKRVHPMVLMIRQAQALAARRQGPPSPPPTPTKLAAMAEKKAKHAANRARRLSREVQGITREPGDEGTEISDSDSDSKTQRTLKAMRRVQHVVRYKNSTREASPEAGDKRSRGEESDGASAGGSAPRRKKKARHSVAFKIDTSFITTHAPRPRNASPPPPKRPLEEDDDPEAGPGTKSSEKEPASELAEPHPPKRIRYNPPSSPLLTREGRLRRTGDAEARFRCALKKGSPEMFPVLWDDPQELAGDGGHTEFSSSESEKTPPPEPIQPPKDHIGFPAEAFPDPVDQFSDDDEEASSESEVVNQISTTARRSSTEPTPSPGPDSAAFMDLTTIPPLPDLQKLKEEFPLDPISPAMEAMHVRRIYLKNVALLAFEDAKAAMTDMVLAEKELREVHEADQKLFGAIGSLGGREAVESIVNDAEARIKTYGEASGSKAV